MPHVVVKLYPGKSEAQKTELAEAISQSVQNCLGNKEASISVAFEEVEPENWPEVYKTEIKGKWEQVYKKPGYEM